jgi:hypothetical protein
MMSAAFFIAWLRAVMSSVIMPKVKDHLCQMSFMLSIAFLFVLASAVMTSVVTMSGVAPYVLVDDVCILYLYISFFDKNYNNVRYIYKNIIYKLHNILQNI